MKFMATHCLRIIECIITKNTMQDLVKILPCQELCQNHGTIMARLFIAKLTKLIGPAKFI